MSGHTSMTLEEEMILAHNNRRHNRAQAWEARHVRLSTGIAQSRQDSTWSMLISLMNSALAMTDGSINARILDSVVWTVAHALTRMPTSCVIIGSRYYRRSYRALNCEAFVTVPSYRRYTPSAYAIGCGLYSKLMSTGGNSDSAARQSHELCRWLQETKVTDGVIGINGLMTDGDISLVSQMMHFTLTADILDVIVEINRHHWDNIPEVITVYGEGLDCYNTYKAKYADMSTTGGKTIARSSHISSSRVESNKECTWDCEFDLVEPMRNHSRLLSVMHSSRQVRPSR